MRMPHSNWTPRFHLSRIFFLTFIPLQRFGGDPNLRDTTLGSFIWCASKSWCWGEISCCLSLTFMPVLVGELIFYVNNIFFAISWTISFPPSALIPGHNVFLFLHVSIDVRSACLLRTRRNAPHQRHHWLPLLQRTTPLRHLRSKDTITTSH